MPVEAKSLPEVDRLLASDLVETREHPLRYPPWVVLHVPHDARDVPDGVRHQFLLTDEELNVELLRMTDHHTLALFAGLAGLARPEQVVRFPVSRLVVDVERFEVDAEEPMAARGMGAIYAVTSALMPLRRPLAIQARQSLMQNYYWPHHARLQAAVDKAVSRFGRCLVLDCHSFPAVALPYELTTTGVRPEVCIGTDAFHTPQHVADAFVQAFEDARWRTSLNEPFAGALVPVNRYRQDPRVLAVMVEINRSLYMDESTGERLPQFDAVAERVTRKCIDAANKISSAAPV